MRLTLPYGNAHGDAPRSSLLFHLPRLFGSVRIRLTLWYLAILALVFLVFGGIVYGTLAHEAEMTEQDALITAANQLQAAYNPTTGTFNVDDPWLIYPPGPGKAASVLTKGRGKFPLDPYDIALVVDTHGNVNKVPLGFATTDTLSQLQLLAVKNASLSQTFDGMLAAQLTVTTPDGITATLNYRVYIAPLTAQGQRLGTLVVARVHATDSTTQALMPGLLIAGPLTLLVAAIGGYWLATRAMRPVRLITRTAREIGETDLSRRLNLPRRDELGELAQTFDRMLGRLESAFTRQRQFTADASHELRTPLTIVNLEVTRALASPRAPEEYERILATVQAENDYMTRLVNDLLILARADAGQAAPRAERVDLSDITLDVVERLAPLAREKGVALTVGTLPELFVTGDRSALTRMLSNLVENAIKYAPAARGSVSVASGSGKLDGWCWVRVEDNGPGIPPEHQPHIFDRFYRVESARTQSTGASDAALSGAPGGSGLGLAIAQWAAREHGGEVSVRSAPGVGSVFEVWLPLCAGVTE